MKERRNRSSPAAAATFMVLGGYTLFIQVILLRECFSLFSGNELSVAIQLGLWLCFTAAGGALGTLLPSRSSGILLAILPLGGVCSAVAVRVLPLVLPVPPGGEIPFGWAVLSLAAAQLPLNVIAGALFPTACRFFAGGDEASAIGRFYALEALGAAISGATFTFLLAGRVAGIELAVWGSAATAAAAAVVLWKRTTYVRIVAAAWGAVLIGAGVFADPAGTIDDLWWQVRQAGSQRVASVETRYQRIDVGFRRGQHTVYSNGIPILAIEDTDESTSGYRIADLYLSLHPQPRRVLIVGAGEAGLLERVADYPMQRIVYVLLDRATLDIARSFSGRRKSVWSNPALTIVVDDGRRYLQQTCETFDMIVLDLPSPHTAAGNRFFTVQAFQAARSRLRDGGVLVFSLPSSAHHIQVERGMLLSAIHRALSAAFGRAEIIAGDRMIFVAGLPGPVPPVETLARRFAARGVGMTLASGRVIRRREMMETVFRALHEPQFNEFRQRQQLGQLLSAGVAANDDGRPVAYYLNLRRWVREIGLSQPIAERLFDSAEKAVAAAKRYWLPATLAAAVLGALLVVMLRARKTNGRSAGPRAALAAAMLVSGWAGMLGELAVLFMYQNALGQIYHAMGALLATYMIALVAGNATSTRLCVTRRRRVLLLLVTRALMIGSCGVVVALSKFESAPVFFAALFVYAFALGMEYPVANSIYRRDEGGKHAAGVLHSMDHLGAALATILGGTILLPLVGPRSTLLAVACMHVVALSALSAMVVGRGWPIQDRKGNCPG